MKSQGFFFSFSNQAFFYYEQIVFQTCYWNFYINLKYHLEQNLKIHNRCIFFLTFILTYFESLERETFLGYVHNRHSGRVVTTPSCYSSGKLSGKVLGKVPKSTESNCSFWKSGSKREAEVLGSRRSNHMFERGDKVSVEELLTEGSSTDGQKYIVLSNPWNLLQKMSSFWSAS